MVTRPNAVTFKGNPMTLVGPQIKVGDFRAKLYASLLRRWIEDHHSSRLAGKPTLLSVVPSLDTGGLCDSD